MTAFSSVKSVAGCLYLKLNTSVSWTAPDIFKPVPLANNEEETPYVDELFIEPSAETAALFNASLILSWAWAKNSSLSKFGEATSPLQNASSSIGSGTILKGIKQQFTQGNVTSSLNALDLAISGQGFFALRPSLTTNQTVYTRNGSFSVNNDRFVVDSAGQYVLALPVSNDGSVQGGEIADAAPLKLELEATAARGTSNH